MFNLVLIHKQSKRAQRLCAFKVDLHLLSAHTRTNFIELSRTLLLSRITYTVCTYNMSVWLVKRKFVMVKVAFVLKQIYEIGPITVRQVIMHLLCVR